MKCDTCDQEVAVGSAFCPHCGTPLAGDDDAGDVDVTEGRAAWAKRLKPSNTGSADKNPAEEDLWSGTYSPKAMVGWAIAAGLLTVAGLLVALLAGIVLLVWMIGVVVVWGLLGLVLLYRRLTVRYRLTTYRFFHETGLLSRTRNRVEVIDINDVTLHQGVIERMFDVGTIHVQSSDRTDPDLYLPGIENVRMVTDLIDDTRRAERRRRGLFMENIG